MNASKISTSKTGADKTGVDKTSAGEAGTMSRRAFICGTTVAAMLGAACVGPRACLAQDGKAAGDGSESGATATVRDSTFGEVELHGEATRIVTTAPAYTVSILLAGAAEKIVALDNNSIDSDWLNEKFPFFNGLPAACSSSDINIETILSLDPDLVALAPKYKEAASERLAELGITCISSPQVSEGASLMDQTMETASYYGDAIGGTSVERARQFADYFAGVRANVSAAVAGVSEEDRPRVLVVNNLDPLTVVNGNPRSMCQEWIALAGGRNVAGDNVDDGVSGRIEVSMEQVLAWDPQIVVCDSTAVEDGILESASWANVSAVQTGDVAVMPKGLMQWGYNGPEVALMAQFAAKLVHPELFDELDLVETMRAFYSDMFDIELTDEDYGIILRTDLPKDDYMEQTFTFGA